MKYLFSIILVLSTLSSCTKSVKEKFGFTYSGPNEKLVEPHKELEVPPHFRTK